MKVQKVTHRALFAWLQLVSVPQRPAAAHTGQMLNKGLNPVWSLVCASTIILTHYEKLHLKAKLRHTVGNISRST